MGSVYLVGPLVLVLSAFVIVFLYSKNDQVFNKIAQIINAIAVIMLVISLEKIKRINEIYSSIKAKPLTYDNLYYYFMLLFFVFTVFLIIYNIITLPGTIKNNRYSDKTKNRTLSLYEKNKELLNKLKDKFLMENCEFYIIKQEYSDYSSRKKRVKFVYFADNTKQLIKTWRPKLDSKIRDYFKTVKFPEAAIYFDRYNNEKMIKFGFFYKKNKKIVEIAYSNTDLSSLPEYTNIENGWYYVERSLNEN